MGQLNNWKGTACFSRIVGLQIGSFTTGNRAGVGVRSLAKEARPMAPGTSELEGRRGSAPVALCQEGQGGQRCPFNLKDCLREIANCQKCQCNSSFTNLLQKTQEMQSLSFKNSTIAWRRTPSHLYHPINRKHD